MLAGGGTIHRFPFVSLLLDRCNATAMLEAQKMLTRYKLNCKGSLTL